MRFTSVAAALAAATLTALPVSAAVALDDVTEVCRFSDDRLTEISGMTYSQRHPDVVYLHNDSSGGPFIYAVDSTTCRTLATLTLDGIEARDIEAIGSGRDRRGRPILWIADVGDNRDSWPEVRLHRVREPRALTDRALTVKTYRFTYPDRPHNAEAILSDPTSPRVWIVTKQSARGSLYALPNVMETSGLHIAERVGRTGAFVTDGSIRPDGAGFALRDYVDAQVFAGLPPGEESQRVYLPIQFQGEAMTWTSDAAALLVASERDDRLLRIELASIAVSTPTVTPDVAGSPEPSEPWARPEEAETTPDQTGGEASGIPWAPMGLAAVGVACVGILLGLIGVRRRRGGRSG